VLLLAAAQDPEEELVALLTLKLAKQEHRSGRYGWRGPYDRLKSHNFLELIIDKYSPRWFKAWMRCITSHFGLCHGNLICVGARMLQESFWHLPNIISGDRIFISMGQPPQCPVKVQLACFLIQYGSISSVKTAGEISIAEGMVHLYCHQVQPAFCNVWHAHLSWLGKRRKAFLKDQMAGWGFPGCIGIVDGSLIRLREKPHNNGWAY